MNIVFFKRNLLCAFALLTGCATYRSAPLPPDHPANPAAREAATPPARRMLGLDATTRATRERFAAADAAQHTPELSQQQQQSQPAMQQQHDMQNMEHGAPARGGEKAIYTCPMHPEVRQDHPGKCPKCGMTLQKEEPQR